MLKINFLLAIRKLKKDKKSFFLNLIGSSVGLASIILMAVYVSYEKSYDTFNTNDDQLFRIERSVSDNVQGRVYDGTPYELADELKTSFPEIVNTASVATTKNYFSINGQLFQREEGLVADNSFTEMFTFNFIEGDGKKALSKPMSIALSESIAKKLFGNNSALGKTIRLDKKADFNVTAIYKDYPKDSHLNADYLISYNSYENLYGVSQKRGWDKNYSCTYLQVAQNAQGANLSQKISRFLDAHTEQKEGITQWLTLRPVKDIYLNTTHVQSDIMAGIRNNIVVIYLFMAIMFFTAFITALNYISMNTSQLMGRELEIGMKKVLGISKNQLRAQFILESVIMIFCITLVSLILAYAFLPVFNFVVDRDLSLSFSENWLFLVQVILGTLFVGFLAGLYPVVYLSSLKISSFLQGNTSFKRKKFMRKGLVVLQLLMAVPLIFNSILIINQIGYLKDKDTGFEKENVLIAGIRTPEEYDKNRLVVLKDQLEKSPEVLGYSISEGAPFFASGSEVSINWEGGEAQNNINVTTYEVDYDFQEVYKMKLLNGRWFSKDFTTDAQKACVINETTVALLGWKNPIGKTLDNGKLKVVGVVKDFNQSSLFLKIPPMVLRLGEEDRAYSVVSIKTLPENRAATERMVNQVFNDSFQNTPIEFKFLDVGFDNGFMSVLENVMRLFMVFSIISIVLVIIGLFGLVSFALGTQRKMIAIRRVLGATVKNLFVLLTKEYLILCGITMLISLAITFALNSHFMDVFAYKAGIRIIDLLSVVVITLLVVFVTISGKILTASKARPVNALTRE